METRFDKVTIKNQSFDSLSATVKQQRGSGQSQMVVSFDNVADMRSCFTEMRVDLLIALSESGPLPVGDLAAKLKRSRTAVARDVSALARTGVIATESAANPGHGRITVVKSLARRYEFVWSIDAAPKQPASKSVRRKGA